MASYYFDTSVIVKYYHTESGSVWVRQTIDAPENIESTNLIYLAEIAIAESAAALAILARTHQISVELRDASFRQLMKEVVQRFRTIHVTRDDIDAAAELTQRHALKGYDAVQLAVAISMNRLLEQEDLSLIFVSADNQLLQAAQSEKLRTDNPFNHTDLDNA